MLLQLPLHLRPRLIMLLVLVSFVLRAQKDTLPPEGATDVQEQLIEDVLANSEDDTEEFSFNGAFDLLDDYLRRPLNLNKATYEELTELLLLSPIQVGQILEYRDRMGSFLSPYELQVIPSMDLEAIRRLTPFVRVGNDLDDAKIPLGRMLAEGDRELFMRWQRRLETTRGYELGPEDGVDNYYLGSQDRFYVRFRQRYSNKMSFGITAEKDPGEAFFAANNKKRGFDYYSGHFYLADVNRTVKALALGDFSVSFGQGLILYTGFGFGKSSQATNVARGGKVLRPYTSVNELSFMRGAATTLALGEKVELSVFASRRGRTANIAELPDSLTLENEDLGITSLDLTGLNRTPNEVEDRNSITQVNFGGSLRYRASQRLQLGFNVLSTNLSRPLELRDQAYNRFFFRGTDLINAGIDYRYRLRNFTFFGEIAGSQNLSENVENTTIGVAQIHGLMMGLDRFVDLSVVYRNYGVGYQALNARPFGETTGARNEEGLYFGLEVRPGKHWRINAYYDLFRFPYLRFNIDAPSEGHEYRFRVTYWQKRKMETYLELRSETKGFGTDGDESVFTNLDPVVARTRFQARLHFSYKIDNAWEWRSRFDAGFTEDPLNGQENGFMIYQDLRFRPSGPFSFTARMAIFDTDGFNVRFYQYENGLLYNARVIPYYHQGTRAFFLVRYKGIRGLTLEGRIAQTFYTDGTIFDTGLEATGGPRRTDAGLQAIWRF
ncbi:MAG: hypothetical protein ACI81P_003434 [Neolewinella sp.]|jgi:hypothetical protein